jgi:hypothetical protein
LKESRTGIPVLSKIPLLGGLFRNTTIDKIQKEVIVVLTPHVIPIEDRRFSYTIPKDSDIFDAFGYQLFRNAYRARHGDIFDFSFIYENPAYKELTNRVKDAVKKNPGLRQDESIRLILNGNVPGEAALVQRMIWESLSENSVSIDMLTRIKSSSLRRRPTM